MIVRMFKSEFAALVKSGAKKQAVGPTPKRMPKTGEKFSGREWLGKPHRSKQRELVGSVVLFAAPVQIRYEGVILDAPLEFQTSNDQFARNDGFSEYSQMRHWFDAQYGLPFDGIVTYWK